MDMKTAHVIEEKERTEDIAIEENVTFEEMYLSDGVLSGLNGCGFIRPSPIQLSAIPLGRCGLDLIVQAKSGTGKTIVFTVVALEMISVNALTTQVLVIAPTREIAVQIGHVINSVGSFFPDLKASTFIGGINLQEDKSKLKCCHIAIGTPGRLTQLVELGYLNLSNVRLLVLDEADQLLTGQFKTSILEVVKTLPFNKQILALSATYPNEVTEFLDQYMRSPSHVRLGRESPALIGVNQFVRLLPDHPQSHMRHKYKFNDLLSILSSLSFNQCLVFSNSQLRAESICNQLKSSGWPASFLTGGQIQSERLQSFYALCSYKCRILVSTDLSARGIDSEHVNLVINLDVPTDQATYLHRVGRAGRFGSMGIAISLVCEGDEWEAMRAVVTLTNINVKVLPEEFNSSSIKLEYESLESIQYLDEENCSKYLQKQNERKAKQKKNNDRKDNYNCSSFDKKQKENKTGKNHNLKKSEMILTKEKLATSSKSDQSGVEENIDCVNGNEIGFATVKSSLNDYKNEIKFHEFSFDDIFNKMSEKWESISKYDHSVLKYNKILKEYPNHEVFNNLEKYVNKRESEIITPKINTLENSEISSKKNLKPLEILDQYLQRIDLSDKNKGNEKLKSLESETSLDINKMVSFVNEDTVNKGNTLSLENANTSDNGKLTTKSSEEVQDIAINHKTLNLNDKQDQVKSEDLKESQVCNSKQTSASPTTKKKQYSLNTGFGKWEPALPKEKSFLNSHHSEAKSCNNDCHETISNEQEILSDKEYFPEAVKRGGKFLNLQTVSGRYNYPQYYNSIDAYIRGAQKYAMMMDYVRSVGKMSAWIAHDNNKKLVQTQKKYKNYKMEAND